jgi:hypothetical protein
MKLLKSDESTSWMIYHYQFGVVADHCSWAAHEKPTYLLTLLQGQATNNLHSNSAEATHEDVTGCRRAITKTIGWCGLPSQLKAKTQLRSRQLQETAMTTEQLAHWTLNRLPRDYKQRKAAYASTDGNEGPGSETASPHGWQEVS